MKKALLFSLCFLSCCCFAELDIKKLSEITQSPDHLSGKFSQIKYLAELEIELPSSGKFAYVKRQSINWQTLEPIENLLVMTPDSIVSHQDGDEVLNLNAATNPAIAMLSELFFAVLTAQWQQLSTYFTLSGELDNGLWHIELQPKDHTLQQVVSRIELQGDDYLRQLTFYEKNGDATVITFTELSQ